MIALHMNRPDHENDIRALLMSFFFGEKIVTDGQIRKLREDEKIFSRSFTVDYSTDGAVFTVSGDTFSGKASSVSGKAAPETENSTQDKEDSLSLSCVFDGRVKERDIVKDTVYELLSEYTGQTLPWGTLTGVRPTKIPMEIMEHGGTMDEAAAYLRDHYRVSQEKAGLASYVAGAEMKIIDSLYAQASETEENVSGVPGSIETSDSAGHEKKGDGTCQVKFRYPAGQVSSEHTCKYPAGHVNSERTRREQNIYRADTEGMPCPGFSLYVGIPFCPSICAYCSFSSFPIEKWKDRVDDYISALELEIKSVSRVMRSPLTFYMGGGTPTSITAEQLDRVLGCIEDEFDMSACLEKTIEAGRPDSITSDKLRVMKKHGIDRISINPQTMNQSTLDLIGRRHSVGDVEKAFYMAREENFENINMDLIVGLPGENAEHMRYTMERVCALKPESITVHSLALKRAAFLNQNRELFPVAGTDEAVRMSQISREAALGLGLRPYYLYRQKNIAGNLENVGYSLPGRECIYNVVIMEECQNILALGGGSVSKRIYPGYRIERCANVKSVDDYIGRIDEMIERKLRLFAGQER